MSRDTRLPRHARRLIEGGWTQHADARAADKSVVHPCDERAVSWSLLGALVQFGAVATIQPGIGAVAFCAVVLVTMFGAEGFDPRRMWDAAGRNPHRPAAARAPVRWLATRQDSA